MQAHNHQQCIQDALAKARQICQTKGLRLTPIREKVLNLIWQSHRPSKAYDILAALDSGKYSAKPPTVYRALDFLLEHRLIHRLHSLNAYVGCTHPGIDGLPQHECYFLICQKCGELSECCDMTLKDSVEAALRHQCFAASRTYIEIQGVCAQCQP